ncbi:hypothetical protein [Dyella tabacisoli]|uniref:Uncharacterized protein n=1 Tax=Dyella tabacisoli TaxID=2282381 RepID=A0A369UMP1_9GAMM|nr:hypothetical protein [Dyella tabacisoli]RDD81791.1 hypothetical protein DVJ77_11615 [Dyella tabacisoli]
MARILALWVLLLLPIALSDRQHVPAPMADPVGFVGSYRNGTERLNISLDGDVYWLNIDSHGSAHACSFSGHGELRDGLLQLSLENWRPHATLTVRKADDRGVDVLSEQEDDRFSLMYFCRNGASLSGHYAPAMPLP